LFTFDRCWPCWSCGIRYFWMQQSRRGRTLKKKSFLLSKVDSKCALTYMRNINVESKVNISHFQKLSLDSFTLLVHVGPGVTFSTYVWLHCTCYKSHSPQSKYIHWKTCSTGSFHWLNWIQPFHNRS
jgi:hypothetical protein